MATQYFCRTLKIATASVGVEPTYSVTIPDVEDPFIKVTSTPYENKTSAGIKTTGYKVRFEVTCLDAVGSASVDALVGTNVWLHAEPDGTIGASNPALTVKDFILNKKADLTATFATPSKVTYYGEKDVLLESDAYAKDTTA